MSFTVSMYQQYSYYSVSRCYHWGEPREGVPEISYNYKGVCKYLTIKFKKKMGVRMGGAGKKGREKKKGMQEVRKA